MESLTRTQIMNELQQSFERIMNLYDIDEIGIFEEEGQGDQYYIGYTVNKSGKTYHIHSPYSKNNQGELTPSKNEWTIETDDPKKADRRGFDDLDSVFQEL